MALSAPLNNGIGRYLCQLKRLTLQYCKNGGSSNGMRCVCRVANTSNGGMSV